MQALKRARANRRLLVVFLALAILSPAATGALATANYKVSIVYTEFNVIDETEHTFPNDSNYTLPWRMDLINKLTYNDTTTNPGANLKFTNYENSSKGIIELYYFKPDAEGKGSVNVYASETTVGNLIDIIPYTIDSPQTLSTVVDGITIKNATDTQLEYNFKAFGISNVSARGAVANCCTAGFMQLEFSSGSKYGLDIVYEMIPLMITLTVIGMVIKMVDKMGKNIR